MILCLSIYLSRSSYILFELKWSYFKYTKDGYRQQNVRQFLQSA